MYKIIGNDGREFGPAGVEQIRIWIAQGRANASTLTQSEGSAEWKPLASFAELAQELKVAPLSAAAHGSNPDVSNKIANMSPKTLLRVLLIANFAIIVTGIIIPSGTPDANSAEPGTAWQWIYAVGMAIAYLVALVGLFFFWRLARPIFLATNIIGVIATDFILGVTSDTALGDSLGGAGTCLSGFILAMVYVSPVRDLFQKRAKRPAKGDPATVTQGQG